MGFFSGQGDIPVPDTDNSICFLLTLERPWGMCLTVRPVEDKENQMRHSRVGKGKKKDSCLKCEGRSLKVTGDIYSFNIYQAPAVYCAL